MIVVFDFDKTLTYTDTLLGFYRHCSGKHISSRFKLPLYFLLMVLHKIGVISNATLKSWGITCFLRGRSRAIVTKWATEYSAKIELNQIYYHEIVNDNKPYIISASFCDYILPLFQNAYVYGSELAYDSDAKVEGLKFNCYGRSKCQVLEERGIYSIDILYTDSISDLPLAKMSNSIKIVRGDEIITCKDLEHFKSLL